MATKQSTSYKTTTNLQTGQSKSFKTTYKTSTPTNIGKGGLGAIGRLGTIAITILAVSVGTALTQFNTLDLIETTPNYQLKNQYVAIDDPLNTINYIQYGEEVFTRVNDFIHIFSDAGQFAYGLWTGVVSIFGGDWNYVITSGDYTYIGNKFVREIFFGTIGTSLDDAKAYYNTLTTGAKQQYALDYAEFNFTIKWMYYSPAELNS
jgi:hypothetical protein